MRISYIDANAFAQIGLTSSLDKYDVSIYNDTLDYLFSLDDSWCEDKLLVIFDIPIKEARGMNSAAALCHLKNCLKSNLTLVLYSDFSKLACSYLVHYINPDLVIDKRKPISNLKKLVDKIIYEEPIPIGSTRTPNDIYLTHCEFEYIYRVSNGLGVKEIAKCYDLNTKAIYAHRRNVIRKYNLKGFSGLVSSIFN